MPTGLASIIIRYAGHVSALILRKTGELIDYASDLSTRGLREKLASIEDGSLDGVKPPKFPNIRALIGGALSCVAYLLKGAGGGVEYVSNLSASGLRSSGTALAAGIDRLQGKNVSLELAVIKSDLKSAFSDVEFCFANPMRELVDSMDRCKQISSKEVKGDTQDLSTNKSVSSSSIENESAGRAGANARGLTNVASEFCRSGVSYSSEHSEVRSESNMTPSRKALNRIQGNQDNKKYPERVIGSR